MTRARAIAGALVVLTLAAACGSTNRGDGGRATLTASPNPLLPEIWPRSKFTTIRWNTGTGSVGRVFVSTNGEPEQLFAQGSSGAEAIPWIATGPSYQFRLESVGPPATTLASLVVTRQDDGSAAIQITAVGAVVFALLLWRLAPGRRRSWLLEAGFLFVVVSALWVTLVVCSRALRFYSGAAPHDRTVLSATLAWLFLASAPLVLMGRRARAVVAVGVAVSVTALAASDLIHARFFDTVITIGELTTVTQLALVPSSAVSLVRWADARYFIVWIVVALGLVAYLRACRRVAPLDRRTRLRLAAALVVAAIAAAIPTIRLARSQPDYFSDTWAHREAVGRMGLISFHVRDVASHLANDIRRSRIGQADRRQVVEELDTLRPVQTLRSDLFGIARGQNVILINSESINAFPIGLRVGGEPVAPRLDALRQESLWFTNSFEQADLGKSSDAELLVLESLFPLADGAYAARYPTRTPHGLPAILADLRYHTLSATGTSGEIWNMNIRHPRQPFQHSFFGPSFPGAEWFNGGVSDREFFAAMAGRLAQQPQPFLAFLMSASSHVPYALPPAHRTLDVGELSGTLLGEYLQAVHYFDESLGAFVDALRSSGVLDRSILVIYGDHHAYLEDRNALASLVGLKNDDAFRMWRVQATVPLLIRLPHGESPGPRSVAAGPIDIAPTLLHLLGLDDTREAMFGRDLTTTAPGFVVFRDGSFVDDTNLYLAHGGADASAACYDLATRAPADCAPLETQHRDALARLAASDLIVEGDLAPSIVAARAGAPAQ